MRPLRDWAYKKIEETPDNHFEIVEAMVEEEAEEVKDLLASYPDLQNYLQQGKTPQDFINEYESLGWDLRFCKFRLVWEDWINKQTRSDSDDPSDWAKSLDIIDENLSHLHIPKELAWKLYSPDIPEEYKTWGFAVYFTDNDFSGHMEILGKIIGEKYLEELEEITKVYFLYEDIVNISIAEKCKQDLSRYFDLDKLRTFLDCLYPAAQHMIDWRYHKGDLNPSEAERTREYLDLKNCKAKIGPFPELRKWLISDLGWTEEVPGEEHIWCNAEVVLVTTEDEKLKVQT